jgi:hypothetical protein
MQPGYHPIGDSVPEGGRFRCLFHRKPLRAKSLYDSRRCWPQTDIALVFVMIAAGGHLNSIAACSRSKGRQNRLCLPLSDNRQKRPSGVAVLAGWWQFLPAVTEMPPPDAGCF